MPVSDCHGIPAVMNEVARLNPSEVIELGIGFGKWGVLLREVLDARHGRLHREDWQATILGVEIYPGYRNPAWSLYTRVIERDFLSVDHKAYDLVMMIDSLEHLTPGVGRPFLERMVTRNDAVIISVPNGHMDQGETFGNPYEAHRWTFTDLEEFEAYNYKVLHRGVCTVVSIQGVR